MSPMNSHSAALTCRDTLCLIFEKLSLADLARASCVCKAWNAVASDEDMIVEAFKAPWKLLDVVGKPCSRNFWRDTGIGKFAISHRILRGDTVASLAVKYSSQVMDIKRVNNMMSDHGIYSRERLLIPITNPDILINGTCYIELDAYAKHEGAVLYPGSKPEGKLRTFSNRVTCDRGKRRVIDSLKRSMQVDDGTAQYYLSISDGDPRAALSQFSSDLSWERQTGLA
ncbi:F-box protein [Hibiscus syriacus]|uniref:F-box protein n=1 Tax=Hibiscus syriacus TaxID=106335 RepID=A0A6A2Z7C6_HIBSY|nr:F-box protein [Hibiscus syriacus]